MVARILARDTVSGVVSAAIDPSTLGGSPVLWKWNGVDASQFGPPVFLGGMDPLCSVTLSAGTTTWGGQPALDVAVSLPNCTLGQMAFVPVTNFALPKRYVLRYRLTGAASNVANEGALGFQYFGTPSGDYSFSVLQSNWDQFRNYRLIEAGSFTYTGGAGTTVNGFRPYMQFETDAETLSVAPTLPGLTNFFLGSTITVLDGGFAGLGGVSQQDRSLVEVGATLSTWAGQDLANFGLAIGYNAAGPYSVANTFQLDTLEILKHPMDL